MNGTPGPRVIPVKLIAAALRRDDRVVNVDHHRGHAVITWETGLAVFSWRPGRSKLKEYVLSLYGPGYQGGGEPAGSRPGEDTAGTA